MKMYGGVEVEQSAFLESELDEGECTASRADRFDLEEIYEV
jgi:hypothetical protein